MGNPYLSPSYTSTIGANLLLFGSLYFGFDYTKNKDAVELVMKQIAEDDPTANAQYRNIPHVDSYMLTGYIPIPINKNFYAGIEFEGGKKKRKYDDTTSSLWRCYVALEAQLTIARDWYLEFYGSYINRDFSGNMILQDYYPIDLSLKRTFMNKKLQVSLNGQNIFGKKTYVKMREATIDRDLYMSASDKCSRFTLSMSYTFGGKNKVKAERVKAGNTEERER